MQVVFDRKVLVVLFAVCSLVLSFCSDDSSSDADSSSGKCTGRETDECLCDDGSSGLKVCINGEVFSDCQCAGSSPDIGSEGECEEGQTADCTCDDGSAGVKVCLSDQFYSTCQCTTSSPGIDSSVPGADSSVVGPFDSGVMSDGSVVATGDGSVTTRGNSGTDPGGSGVSVPGVQCGPGQGLNSPPVNIGGRDVLINYPCNKPAGTKVTFILILHGTQADENLKFYQHAYLGSFKYVDTHNFIVASPKAIGSQWGRGDNGQDRPHIMEVIDWVYSTFSEFDIASMWVAGHSWGAAYSRTFVCELQQSRGVILQSGGPQMPACADRLSVIATVGETDIAPGLPEQTTTASAHGCDGPNDFALGNNTVTEWPNCDPGWAHKNYLMLGKGHGFVPTDWPDEGVTKDIADAISSAM